MASSILYRGPSMLDGAPIVVIATDGSKNGKTGGMVQTWILRDDIDPNAALKSGDDSSVCGDCPHRGAACYVTVFQAPLSVYRAYKRGRYADFRPGQYAGRKVRIGSYGDPAAVPVDVWRAYTEGSAGITGYTHQWRIADPELRAYCMASCDTAGQADDAHELGWRTFRVRLESEPTLPGEVMCPASDEAGHKLTCEECTACCGTRGRRKGHITIIVHGAKSKVNAFKGYRIAVD
jgi:hypothetical protein